MDKQDWMLAATAVVIPVVGAASAVIMEKAATKYGHTFMRFGPNNVFLIGVIGAVQNLASIILGALYAIRNDEENKKDDTKSFIVAMVIGHVLTAAALTALTALAAKVNLISARLTLFGAVVLTTTSLIENLASAVTVRKINNA